MTVDLDRVDPIADADDQPIAPRGISPERVVTMIIVVTVVVFWMVMTSWRPWDLFARGGFSTDFYDEQARVFLRGGLAVDPSIPGPEGFLIDGKTYLYYGPFLSIVRLPFMLFGDLFVGRLTRISMLIALVVLLRWSARLARAGQRVLQAARPDRRIDERWAIGLFTAAVAFSPALYASSWVSVYDETELWALALATIGVTLIVEWAATGFTDRRMAVGASVAAAATTLTRAPIGVGVCIALFVCGVVLLWRDRDHGFRRGRIPLLGAILPVLVHVAVNVAKFGTLLSVPADKQLLSLTDPERGAWFAGNNGSFFSPRFLPTTLVQYWRPDALRFERLIPGVRFGPLATDRGSYPVEQITPATSLTVSALLLLLLAVVGVVWMLRQRCRTWLLVVVATAIGALPTFAIGFVANRYLIDMLPPLMVGGAVGVWVVVAWPRQRVVRGIGVVLAVWGLWVNAALATWTIEYKSAGFTELRYDLDHRIFGAGAPGLTTLVAGVAVPRDGMVALDPACAGVYIAEQGRWVALERADGVRRTGGTVAPEDLPATLARGRGWTLVLSAPLSSDDPVVQLDVLDDEGTSVWQSDVATSLPTDYDVIVDTVTGEYRAEFGDALAFLPTELVATGGTISPATPPVATESPLCLGLRTSL